MNPFSHILSGIAHAYAYRHEPEQFRVLAEAWWRGTLVASALLVVGAIALGAYVFSEALSAMPEHHADAATPGVTFDAKLLSRVLGVYAERQAAYDMVKGSSSIADPSK